MQYQFENISKSWKISRQKPASGKGFLIFRSIYFLRSTYLSSDYWVSTILFDARRKLFPILMYLNNSCIDTDLRISFLSLEFQLYFMRNQFEKKSFICWKCDYAVPVWKHLKIMKNIKKEASFREGIFNFQEYLLFMYYLVLIWALSMEFLLFLLMLEESYFQFICI